MSYLFIAELVQARGLKSGDIGGGSDPWAVLTIDGEEVVKTGVVKKTINPEWYAKGYRIVNKTDAEKIKIKIYDSDIGSDDEIGKIKINFFTVGQIVDEWYKCADGLISSGKGEVRVRLGLLPLDSIAEWPAQVAAANARVQAATQQLAELSASASASEEQKAAIEASLAQLKADDANDEAVKKRQAEQLAALQKKMEAMQVEDAKEDELLALHHSRVVPRIRDSFEKIFEVGSLGVYRAYLHGGYVFLGDVVGDGRLPPWANAYKEALAPADFFAKPTGYTNVWTSSDGSASLWQPTAPDGYVALGSVANNSGDAPDIAELRVVNVKYTSEFTSETYIGELGKLDDVGLYTVTDPAANPQRLFTALSSKPVALPTLKEAITQ